MARRKARKPSAATVRPCTLATCGLPNVVIEQPTGRLVHLHCGACGGPVQHRRGLTVVRRPGTVWSHFIDCVDPVCATSDITWERYTFPD